MKHKKTLLLRIFPILPILLVLANCSKTETDPLVGKWQAEGRDDIIEFFSDGTVVTYATGSPENLRWATWSKLDSTRIKLTNSEESPKIAEISEITEKSIVLKINSRGGRLIKIN